MLFILLFSACNLRARRGRVNLTGGFGLLHGMGFAGVLGELGIPRDEFVTALLSFNAGVEAGQLTVLLAAFAAVGWLRKESWYRSRVTIPLSLVIAGFGLYWALERSFSG